MKKDSLTPMFLQILLWSSTVVMIFPIFIMFSNAFRTNSSIISEPFDLIGSYTLDNVIKVLTQSNFLQYLTNSVIVTVSSTFFILLFGLMIAYPVARYKFFGRQFLYLFFLSGLMLPMKLAIIPLFVQMKLFNLTDTLTGLIVLYVVMGLPSAVFIFTGFLRSLPIELEEAARIDGASEALIMYKILVPLVTPAIAIVGIYNSVPIWNDFFFPLIFIHDESKNVLPQGLTIFMGEHATDWGAMFAGLTLAALPIIIIYISMTKKFIAGLTAGAVK